MASGIPTLKNISVVQCAILISLSKELKREILCVRGSEFDACKVKYQYYRKEQWNAIVVRKAKEVLNNGRLTENLQENVISILPAIGLRMLLWAEYHEGTLGLTRDYSLNFIRNSHFTWQGLIENKKAAEEMIKDVNLNMKQKYKLACIYCFINPIFTFYREVLECEKIFTLPPDYKSMRKPEIVEYWTFQVTDMALEGSKYTPPLEKCIKSGSKEAVKYSLAKTTCLRSKKQALIYSATEVLEKISLQNDWIVFRDQRFDNSKESWIPNYFYVDILCFIMSNMTEAQQKKALEKNIKTYTYVKNTTVLEMFLCWPYQDYFMKTAVLLWDLMPRERYVDILYKICEIIEPRKFNILYGEENSYDYKKILKDFWNKSPHHFKRFVFTNNKHLDYWTGVVVTTKPPSIDLVFRLIAMRTFTYDVEQIISLILDSATIEEKAILTSTEMWKSHSKNALKRGRFEIFDRLLLILCKSEDETREFKNKLNFFNIGCSVCCYFLKYSKIKLIKSLINWMSLSEGELHSIKCNIIDSRHWIKHCRNLLLSRRYNDFEECIKWFLPSTENAIQYKRSLALNINKDSHANRFPVHNFGEKDVLDFMTCLTDSKLPIQEAIKRIPTSVADKFGQTICEDLIAGSSFEVIYEEKSSLLRVKTEFTGGQWERVDEFLRWSFSTEEEILKFKETIFDVDIHFQLIKANQWKEAKTFFEWLKLPADEIKDLKKETLEHNPGKKMFHHLVFGGDEMDDLETIDLFLRWNLTDKISVIKFRDVFFTAHDGFDDSRLMKLCKIIDNYLDELDQEDSWDLFRFNPEERFLMKLEAASSKRKSTYSFSQKKIRKEESHNGNTGNLSKRRSQRLLNRIKKT